MPITLLTSEWAGHALLDSGDGLKLERFGPVTIVREEPKAWWRPRLKPSLWAAADAVHERDGRWRLRTREIPRHWPVPWAPLTLEARLTEGSKHLGLFPEQAPHWEWIRERAASLPGGRLLNLFGYTGVASLVAAAAGWSVTHVDASKPSIAWGRHNQALSNLGSAPIRWILDDALKFVGREVRRGARYDLIALDPPSFGRGPNKEVWKAEKQLRALLDQCRLALSERPVGVVLTLYNLEASSLMLRNLVGETFQGLPGTLVSGELGLRHRDDDRTLPLSLFARWG